MDRAQHVAMIILIFTSLASVFVIVRFCIRGFLVRRLGLDDWLILAGMITSWGMAAVIEALLRHGLGTHIDELSPDQIMIQLKMLLAHMCLYDATFTLVKLSILVQFLRFFQNRRDRILTWVLIGLVGGFGVTTMIALGFICTPLSYFWDKSIPGGQCFNMVVFGFFAAGFNILTDVMLCILPMPTLRSLHLPKRQKYSLIVVFALGGFAAVTGIVRLLALCTFSRTNDPSYDNIGTYLWSTIEVNTGIICGSLPTLRPLITSLWPKMLATSRRTYPRQTVSSSGVAVKNASRQDSSSTGPSEAASKAGHFEVAMIDRADNARPHQGAAASPADDIV